jgi:hypothetical protein
VEAPANDPNVIAVGGTSLTLNTSTGAVSAESAWFYGGGASSQFLPALAGRAEPGCPQVLFDWVPDVALVADLTILILVATSFSMGNCTSSEAPAGCADLGRVLRDNQPSSL